MTNFSSRSMRTILQATLLFTILSFSKAQAQTLAFPSAEGFGRFAKGARGAATQEVYIVTNLNDAGAGSFRDAVSKPGRIVTFAVGGIVRLVTDIGVAANVTIAGQTAPGDGIEFFNKRITFSSASNTIARFLRVRLGATGNSGNDASGLANGANMIFDHMSFSWGMDETFSINWDDKGTAPDNITLQNCIIGQGLFRENHSAGGLIQTPDGGKVSLLRNLYISNKTRNPKVKGVNEFVNNVVYDWGNGHRLDTNYNYEWSGDAYIMGGSSGVSEVNVINNYFVGGPLTPPSKTTPFSRGTGTFNIYGAGNFMDNNINGVLDGTLVPFDSVGYPGITGSAFQQQAFAYPSAIPKMTAAQSYQYIIDSVGACYPRRDPVDEMMIDEVRSKGTKGVYMYRETYNGLPNGGLGYVYGAPAPLDTDSDGMPDAWETANGLNKNNKADATTYNASYPQYLNIEVYINGLISTPPPVFIKSPTNVTLSATSTETPTASSTVVISWTDNSDNELNFILERSLNGTTYTDITHPIANATTYTDNGLVPNTTYYYRLKSANATDTSAYSSPVSIKTPALPSAPTVANTPTPANGFQFQDLNAGSIVLKWLGGTTTTTYSVYFGTDSTNLSKEVDIPYVAAPSYTKTGLLDSVTYYWRIDAINSKGTASGPTWSFRTIKPAARGLVGYYAFDETADAGNRITDSSIYQSDGVLGLDQDQNIRVQGKFKNALDFATATENMYVVSVPNKDNLYIDKGSFSLSFWMKATLDKLPTDATTSRYLLCKGSFTKNAATGATGKRFNIEFKTSTMRFAVDDDVTKDELALTAAQTTPFFTGKWVHVVAYRDTLIDRLRIYRNDSLISSFTLPNVVRSIGEPSALIVGNIGELEFLGTTATPAPYKGMLDELRIYNYALTAPEVTALYNAGNQVVLPVTVSAFKASKESNRAKIEWTTATEQNSDRFEVERSDDGRNFTLLTTVKSKGTSVQEQHYTTYDNSPLNGTNYYRLKQYDLDGKETNYGTRTVDFNVASGMRLQAYPNPANELSNIQFTIAKPGSYSLSMYDAKGVLVKVLTTGNAVTNTNYSFNLNTLQFSPGVYTLKLVSESETKVQRIIVQR